MKKNLLMSAALAAMIFASCSKEAGVKNDQVTGETGDVAYVAIRIEAQRETRAGSSSESDGTGESATNTLYLLTFDEIGNIVATPDGDLYTEIVTTDLTPEAQKISANSESLVVIANPGEELEAAIITLSASSTFASFNAAITEVTVSDIVDGTKGFAMITGGDDTDKEVGETVLNPFVVIGGYLKVVTDETDADEIAKGLAEDDPLPVKLERFAAKLMVKEGSNVIVADAADFTLTNWTVDAVNTRYYPFAEKTLIAGHTGTSYAQAFYTKDPNFTNRTGISYGTVDENFGQVLPMPWKNPGATDISYVIENTMASASQTFGNTTRIVMKATYFPENFEGPDWFSWAGTDYESLDDLQAAYADVSATQTLKDACDHFYTRIKAADAGITGTDFASLTEDDLDGITAGGQVVKEGRTPIILWYKGGVCYYYYEIRHDNDPDAGNMAYAKYGVVRNNWYNLTLNTVSGPGTPWYPEIENPGPGDPGIDDPIDTQAGYLGVSIEIAPWIIRETGMDI